MVKLKITYEDKTGEYHLSCKNEQGEKGRTDEILSLLAVTKAQICKDIAQRANVPILEVLNGLNEIEVITMKDLINEKREEKGN